MSCALELTERQSTAATTPGRRAPSSCHGGTRGILPLIALGAVVLAVVGAAGWNLSGGRLLVMETPSMCPKVCVGSLVADRPLQGALHVGELITFHPPGATAETYTHEVSRIFADGAIQTRGVANPTHDPWLITRSDIVGEGVFSVWGLGWLYKLLPLLAIGVLFWVVARPWIGIRTRRTWDRLWMTVLVVLPLWVLHPLVRATFLSSVNDSHHLHWLSDTLVNTGILPVSFHVAGGQVAGNVRASSLAHVAGPPAANGYLMVHESVSLYWWGWALLGMVVFSPLVGYLWHVLRNDEVVLDGSATI